VLIDAASAQRRRGEGAICFDVDTEATCCAGTPIEVPHGLLDRTEPVLVAGTSSPGVALAVRRFERMGLAARPVIADGPAPSGT